MSETIKGTLTIQSDKNDTIVLDGSSADVRVGPDASKPTIHFNGQLANIVAGGHDQDGSLALFGNVKDTTDFSAAKIHLDGAGTVVRVGGGKSGGKGSISIRDEADRETVSLTSSGLVQVGTKGANGTISLLNQTGFLTISLNGGTGDIFLGLADCAEDFEVAEPAEPGTVMVIDDEGILRPSERAYDRRVAGVISGAGDCRPGIVLGRSAGQAGRRAVALVGRVYCKADARHGAIEIGDLVTTSPTSGHAMKAADPLRAFGAVIGKALRPLLAGTGLIPILVALQ